MTLSIVISLHGLEDVDTVFCVALADLLQCLVLVSSHADVLTIQHIILCHLRLDLCCCQLLVQLLSNINRLLTVAIY